MPSPACTSCLSIFGLVISCVLVIIGIIGITLGPDMLQKQINNQLPLSAYSDQLSSWEVPPVPIYFQVWLWECDNVLDVLNGAKPIIYQRGPFTYAEHRQKVGVYFNENDTVTYRQPISYTFLPEKSAYGEDKIVTMVNTPFVTIVSLVRNLSNLTQEIVNFVAKYENETLFVKHTAGEWIWGYEDPILQAARKVPILKDLVPDDHFGYFYGQNSTDDGLYTTYTGASDITLLNYINKWNGVSFVPYWKTSWARQINGTDGSWFPPLYKKELNEQRLYLYSTDVCRSLYAKFVSHSSVLNIPTEIFAIPSELFVNSTVNPDNAAFGLNVSGVFDVSICRDGAPVFISFPHLLYADETVKGRVDGISPNELEHRTVFEVEQHTGLVLNAQKRLQINVQIKPDRFIDDFKKVSPVILPAIWINESTVIDQSSADDLNNQVLRLFVIVRWVSIALIPIGVSIFILITVIFARRRARYGASTSSLFVESNNSLANPNGY